MKIKISASSMPLQSLLSALGLEIDDPEEEAFLLFSQQIPSQNLGFVDPKATTLDVAVGDRDLTIHQSPTILSSNRSGGTTGAVLWKITPLFAEWISSSSSPFFKHGVLDEGSSVVELGCGISGLIGLTLGPLVKSYLLTDQEYVTKLLHQNLAENFPSVSGKSRRKAQKSNDITFQSLDWETDEIAPSLSTSGSFDAVIACDCIYNDALIQPLVDTCVSVCKLRASAEREKATVCVIAQQLRSAEVFEAWLKAFSKPFRTWRVPEEELAEGLRQEEGFVVHVGVLRS